MNGVGFVRRGMCTVPVCRTQAGVAMPGGAVGGRQGLAARRPIVPSIKPVMRSRGRVAHRGGLGYFSLWGATVDGAARTSLHRVNACL